MTEDEKTAALRQALNDVGYEAASGEPADYASRALLDAVRLILEPFEGECRFCLFPINAKQAIHDYGCPAESWVRAAARAGL